MKAEELIALAQKAMENAYTPYSGFRVGAALLAKSGKVYLGCNVENASFSPTCCAERTAFFSAVAAGERAFEAVAVAGGKEGRITRVCPPCGVCRQVMAEFCEPDFPVYLAKADGFEKTSLQDLLPYSFSLERNDI